MKVNLLPTITKDKFKKYEEARANSNYNMFDPRAMALTDLTRAEWIDIINHYKLYSKKWNV